MCNKFLYAGQLNNMKISQASTNGIWRLCEALAQKKNEIFGKLRMTKQPCWRLSFSIKHSVVVFFLCSLYYCFFFAFTMCVLQLIFRCEKVFFSPISSVSSLLSFVWQTQFWVCGAIVSGVWCPVWMCEPFASIYCSLFLYSIERY